MTESTGTPVRLVPNRCPYCGGSHKPEMCPRLSGIDYFDTGKIRRVYFFKPEDVVDLRPRCKCCGQLIHDGMQYPA